MNATLQNLTDCNKQQHLSGYDLTTLLIRGGLGKLGLNGNAKEVLLYLATCYNEKKGVVYPRVATIAKALGISERGVIRALKELTDKGCILRSKRKRNSNEYIITRKVIESNTVKKLANNDTTKGHDDISCNDTMSSPCIEVKQHELKEQQQITSTEQPKGKNNVVAFSSKTQNRKHRTITLSDVPDFIQKNKKVQNPCAYWASLSEEVREELIQKHNEKLKKQKKKEENRRKQELEKRQYYADLYDTTKATNPRDCANWVAIGKKLGKIKN